jgi:hypothetical protein
VRLPGFERAIIDLAKLRNYCLNPQHEEGKNKARVFQAALGFTRDDAEQLQQMIFEAILTNEAQPSSRIPFGERYVVDFAVAGLEGVVTIRSAWIIRNEEDFPRLTTCYIL